MHFLLIPAPFFLEPLKPKLPWRIDEHDLIALPMPKGFEHYGGIEDDEFYVRPGSRARHFLRNAFFDVRKNKSFQGSQLGRICEDDAADLLAIGFASFIENFISPAFDQLPLDIGLLKRFMPQLIGGNEVTAEVMHRVGNEALAAADAADDADGWDHAIAVSAACGLAFALVPKLSLGTRGRAKPRAA